VQKKPFELKERRGVFTIYLVALFINAFVDLGHKTVIISTIYKLTGPERLFDEPTQIILTSIVSAFILIPFIFLFTISGFLSDKFAKPKIMRWSAFAAVLITLGIAYAYYNGEYYLAFGFTLLLATQSAIYSPAKYGYIKECLGEAGLSVGNAYLMGCTLTSIILGTVFFAGMFEYYLSGTVYESPGDVLQFIAPLAWLLVGLSFVELLATFGLRFYETKYTTLKLSMGKLFSGHYLMHNLQLIRKNQVIWYAILGTAVFWGISQNLLVVFQAHAKANLHIESTALVNGMLALSIFGIISGSYFSGKKSLDSIKVNNVHYGAFVIIVCSILIPTFSIPEVFTQTMLGFVLMGTPASLGLILTAVSIFVFGLGAGMMLVPLNALIQSNAEPDNLGSIIAGKNWVQNIAMVGLLLITSTVAFYDVNSELILYMNAVMALVGFTVVLNKLKSIN